MFVGELGKYKWIGPNKFLIKCIFGAGEEIALFLRNIRNISPPLHGCGGLKISVRFFSSSHRWTSDVHRCKSRADPWPRPIHMDEDQYARSSMSLGWCVQPHLLCFLRPCLKCYTSQCTFLILYAVLQEILQILQIKYTEAFLKIFSFAKYPVWVSEGRAEEKAATTRLCWCVRVCRFPHLLWTCFWRLSGNSVLLVLFWSVDLAYEQKPFWHGGLVDFFYSTSPILLYCFSDNQE